MKEGWHTTGINKLANLEHAAEERENQRQAAEIFLVRGHGSPLAADPPYGKEWNREYNAQPYPEAVVEDEMYDGTGIGFLYGMDSSISDRLRNRYTLEMAGWILVRTGAEVHKTSTKVDKKELSPKVRDDG